MISPKQKKILAFPYTKYEAIICGWSDSGQVTTGRYDEERTEDALSKALREEEERMQNETD